MHDRLIEWCGSDHFCHDLADHFRLFRMRVRRWLEHTAQPVREAVNDIPLQLRDEIVQCDDADDAFDINLGRIAFVLERDDVAVARGGELICKRVDQHVVSRFYNRLLSSPNLSGL